MDEIMRSTPSLAPSRMGSCVLRERAEWLASYLHKLTTFPAAVQGYSRTNSAELREASRLLSAALVFNKTFRTFTDPFEYQFKLLQVF
jgi:hypothetical protein